LKYQGAKFAEVWFKPEGDPFAVTFRIPSESFHIPGMSETLTIENLLGAVSITLEEVETCRLGDVAHSGGDNPHFRSALSPPPPNVSYLDILVRLQAPQDSSAPDEDREPETSAPNWQDLDGRWRAILSLEANLDALRVNMEVLLMEMETLWKKPMTMEEKTYALRADVAQWTKAKSRVHTAVPKLKDFIHRAVWAIASPERKRLETIHIDHIQPQVPFPQIEVVLKQLEDLRKDRQVLLSIGKTVQQECKGIAVELQAAVRALQNNASKAQRKKGDIGSKGQFKT
jgi:hypothetical protein